MSVRERRGKKTLSLPIPPTRTPTECKLLEILSNEISMKDLTILEPIGKGAYSTVFKIKINKSGHIFALKRIKYAETPTQLKNLINEIHSLKTLKHKNILRLYGTFYQDGCVHIIMPLITGLSLAEALKVNSGLPENILGRLTYFTVQGLLYIRRNATIHRDLKPSNILLSLEGDVMISDFGMARQLTASQDKTQSYTGTLSYMAPERVNNELYSYKSDVWSLGLIVYQCALGHFPLEGDPTSFSYWDMLNFVEKDIKVELPDTYSKELSDFILHCLSLKQEERSDITELSEHPWVTQFASSNFDVQLKEWINASYKK